MLASAWLSQSLCRPTRCPGYSAAGSQLASADAVAKAARSWNRAAWFGQRQQGDSVGVGVVDVVVVADGQPPARDQRHSVECVDVGAGQVLAGHVLPAGAVPVFGQRAGVRVGLGLADRSDVCGRGRGETVEDVV